MINIGIFHSRRKFLDLQLDLFKQCVHKNEFKIHLLTQGSGVDYCKSLNTDGLNTEIVEFGYNDNYMSKVRYLISLGGNVVKMDEDVFVGPYTFDFMYESQYRLEDLLIISPCYVTGVPTFDIVYEDYYYKNPLFFDILYSLIQKTEITDIANLINPDAICMNISKYYTNLNNCLHQSQRAEFFKQAGKIPHVYRGIHPIRINTSAHNLMIIWTLENLALFDKENYILEGYKYAKYPYFCNHIYMINSDKYQAAITEFPHGFDEVSINEYRKQYDLKYGFTRYGLGVHLMYSNLCEEPTELNPHSTPNNNEMEDYFYLKLKKLYENRFIYKTGEI